MSQILGFPFVAAVAVGFLFASSANAGVIVAMGDTEGGEHGQIAIEGGSDDVTLVAGQPQPTWDFAEDGNSKGLDVNLDSPTFDSLNNSAVSYTHLRAHETS